MENPNHKEMEQIDDMLTYRCINAEKKCWKKPRLYWLVELHVAKQALSIWSIFKGWKKQGKDVAPIIQCASECNIAIDPDMSEEQIDWEIATLREKVKITHNESANLQDKDLLERVNIASDADDKKTT